jgi:hypothetical protein
MMKLKALAIVFAVIIIILLGILFFYNPVKGPTIPPESATSSAAAPVSSGNPSR